jgi:site-specific DNA-methyltransferase (adenine-specific)
MEETPEAFVENLCLFFDDIKRVLKPTGSMWVNLGDTFNENSGGGVDNSGKRSGLSKHFIRIKKYQKDKPRRSLLMVPYRFAISMIDKHDWCCRNMVIWHKKVVQPTSAKNRLTIEYEPIFFFSHNYRDYYYNSDAAKWVIENDGDCFHEPTKRERRCVWNLSSNNRNTKGHSASYPVDLAYIPVMASCPKDGVVFDPFMGSGTTALAAKKWGCDFLGCDYNKDYCLQASKRLSETI